MFKKLALFSLIILPFFRGCYTLGSTDYGLGFPLKLAEVSVDTNGLALLSNSALLDPDFLFLTLWMLLINLLTAFFLVKLFSKNYLPKYKLVNNAILISIIFYWILFLSNIILNIFVSLFPLDSSFLLYFLPLLLLTRPTGSRTSGLASDIFLRIWFILFILAILFFLWGWKKIRKK